MGLSTRFKKEMPIMDSLLQYNSGIINSMLAKCKVTVQLISKSQAPFHPICIL